MKKTSNLLVLCVCLFLTNSCSHKEDKFKNNLYYANDYETAHGWYDDPRIIRCIAHSGKFACKIDKDHLFSTTFVSKINEISAQGLKKVAIKAWIKVENPKAWAKVVLEVRDTKDSIVFWNGGKTDEFTIRTGEWFPVSFNYDLPPNLNPEGVIKIYLLNQAEEGLLTDDLEIQFEEKN
ncbi:MAG: hypothetical protein ABIT08_17795 [Bacteroidia bacterium]